MSKLRSDIGFVAAGAVLLPAIGAFKVAIAIVDGLIWLRHGADA